MRLGRQTRFLHDEASQALTAAGSVELPVAVNADSRPRRQAGYKTAWHGGQLIVADRWFASSKSCSGCGAVRAKLALSERIYRCGACGLVLDRDLNAALNLAAYGRRQIAGSGPEIANGRGADRKTGPARQAAVKRQPGTAPAGQAGTVPRQHGTAKVSTHAH